jgi:Spy/CpxP family protein refolding chaperone
MAHGGGWGRGGGHMMGWGGGHMMGWGQGYGYDATVTPEQREAVEKLYQEHYEAVAPLREKIWAKRSELNQALSAQTPDSKKVDALTDELAELQTKMFKERTAFRAKLQEQGVAGYSGRGAGRGGWGGHMMGSGYGPGACPGFGGRW